jgi:methionine-rich copper-binding protein CopC
MYNMSKTITIAAAAMLLTATGVFAQNNVFAYNAPVKNRAAAHNVVEEAPAGFKVQLTQSNRDSLVFRLSLENPTADKVVLMIKDRNSNVLHREVIPATPVFVGRYNLQGLEDGNYTFELRNSKERIAQKTIEIKTELAVNRIGSVQ